ncbi:MAG: ATP-binding protein [Planctomycetota bacterium]|jgi:PAS domain S-box-containing protein
MNRLAKMTIKHKLRLILMVNSLIAITVAGLIFIRVSQNIREQEDLKKLQILAETIAQNSLSALQFDIKADADLVLSSIQADPSIVYAIIYDADGQVFTDYASPDSTAQRLMIPETIREESVIVDGHRQFFCPIMLEQARIGTVYFQDNRSEMKDLLKQDILTLLGVLLLALIVSYLANLGLERIVSRPVLALADVARQVTEENDYSIRAERLHADEVGFLVDSFNHMLEQIQVTTSELHKSEARLRRITDNLVGSFIYRHDTDGMFNYVSSSVTQVLGYSTEEFLTHYTDYLTDNPINKQVEINTSLAIQDVPQAPYEVEVFHRDGTCIQLEIAEVPVLEKNGNIIAVEGIAHDITQRKKAEEALEEMVRLLEYKNKELQDIVYTASHDLRSPLVNIQGFSGELKTDCNRLLDLLENSCGQDTPESIKPLLQNDIPQSLSFISGSAKKMNSLLDGLLQLSRLGSDQLSTDSVNMNSLLDHIRQAMQYQITNVEAEVTVNDLPECVADENQINQVFSNLLDNAIKYRSPERPARIVVDGWSENYEAVYSVKDNGIGISEDHAEKVFEIFHRLNPDSSAPGEGLGLTIVKRIISRHNGRVWAESNQDHGATFFVALPHIS